MIYLCEVVAEGVQYFGSTLCTRTWYLVHDHVIEVLYFPTDDQVVDIFTKSLTEAKFSKLRSMLGV